jgi:serine/threonine-protein kinase
MEFLKGRDLVDYCKEGHLLPAAKVVSICARVAEALDYAHRQNVVHRDIKPANIMYELDSDTVKVTDFGIARITDSSKTKTGLVLGTPSFMSPEQIAGKRVDGRSDLYSLGVMLFQMLTGVLPFRGDSMAELMYKIANEQAPDIRVMRSDVPERLANIVALALSKRPETRYQTGDQMAGDLKVVLAELTGDAQAIATAASAAIATMSRHAAPAPAAPGATSGAVAATAKTVAFAPAGDDPDRTMAMNTGASSAPDFDVTMPAFRPETSGHDPRPAASGGAYEKTEVLRRPPDDGGRNGS